MKKRSVWAIVTTVLIAIVVVALFVIKLAFPPTLTKKEIEEFTSYNDPTIYYNKKYLLTHQDVKISKGYRDFDVGETEQYYDLRMYTKEARRDRKLWLASMENMNDEDTKDCGLIRYYKYTRWRGWQEISKATFKDLLSETLDLTEDDYFYRKYEFKGMDD